MDISLEMGGDVEWVELSLTGALGKTIEHRQEVGQGTTKRPYHRKEAIVLGMRQLVNKAVTAGLICVSPSESTTSNTSKPINESGMSLTDWGLS